MSEQNENVRFVQSRNARLNQIHLASRSSLEKELEADISIEQKTGHFYFALTQTSRTRMATEPSAGGTFFPLCDQQEWLNLKGIW